MVTIYKLIKGKTQKSLLWFGIGINRTILFCLSYKEKSKEERVKAANCRPRPIHRERRRPLWVPTPSVERSGLPINGPDLESTGDFDSGSLVHSGSGPPIGDPDPSTEGAGTYKGRRRPRWRGRGCRLVARPRIDWGLQLGVPVQFGVEAAGTHRGR
ncbi:hypothetical protein CRG98_017988 [Punica granatum]|uniref:Uncharacterized protein n=1 Tax=Punica granatum TaxID=22663 RepID=A0A2I0K0L7_PUNGR|nr:hypothetical protein CRG98_017988 [Punica granatum]